MATKMKNHKKYFDALKRLEANRTQIVPKGSKINKDAVALEAGCKRGSIKKSRATFLPLISAIDLAAKKQNSGISRLQLKAEKNHIRANEQEAKTEEGLNRELMLMHKISQLQKELLNYRLD